MWRNKIRANREKWILINQREAERGRERSARPHQHFDATSRSWMFALNSVKPTVPTCEKKQMAKTRWKLGFYFKKQSEGDGWFRWDAAQVRRSSEHAICGPGSWLYPQLAPGLRPKTDLWVLFHLQSAVMLHFDRIFNLFSVMKRFN